MTLVRKKPRPGSKPSSQNSPLNSSPFLHQSAPTHHRAACKSSRSPADNSLGAYFRTSASFDITLVSLRRLALRRRRCLRFCNALQSSLPARRTKVPAPAERMRMMRERRWRQGLRELRLEVPDPRLRSVRKRVAAQVACLNRRNEDDALEWIERVSEFDAIDPNQQ
jgi:hypothetical protein